MKWVLESLVKPYLEGRRIASEYCSVNYDLTRGAMVYFRTGEESPYYKAAIEKDEKLKQEIEEMNKKPGIEAFFKRRGFNKGFIRGMSSILAPILKKAELA